LGGYGKKKESISHGSTAVNPNPVDWFIIVEIYFNIHLNTILHSFSKLYMLYICDMIRFTFYILTKKNMKKSTLSVAFIVTFFATSALFANDSNIKVDQPDPMSTMMQEFNSSDSEKVKINSEVNDLLRKNVKMHKYSSDFAFIMVNDKIERKYKNMNYQVYRFFKYDVDYRQISKGLD
jgi:hypothetical protein